MVGTWRTKTVVGQDVLGLLAHDKGEEHSGFIGHVFGGGRDGRNHRYGNAVSRGHGKKILVSEGAGEIGSVDNCSVDLS